MIPPSPALPDFQISANLEGESKIAVRLLVRYESPYLHQAFVIKVINATYCDAWEVTMRGNSLRRSNYLFEALGIPDMRSMRM